MKEFLVEEQTQKFQLRSQRQSRVHQQFLQSRQTALREISHLLRLQTAAVTGNGQHFSPHILPVFTKGDLEEFAQGSLVACFGSEFAVFDGRRVPRIPNGDLLLFDQVLEIHGQRHALNAPASITSAYDVPLDAWYFRHNASPHVPLSVLMEMALQPCGFLSAYLGTALSAPDQDFLFRNLDGSAVLLADLDLRGQTVLNHASLLSSVNGAGTIIQSFSFCLSCNGVDFYCGKSVFGYFPVAVMARQAGLEDQRPPLKLHDLAVRPRQEWDIQDISRPHDRLSGGQLNFLDEIQASQCGGKFGQGIVQARKTVNPQDWFFSCHFYQDPVMPGSLGVEAIQQAMQAYSLACGLGDRFNSPRFGVLAGQDMQWKYRGQITPQHHEMEIEVQIKDVQPSPDRTIVLADASLWADGKRIYEVLNIGLEIREG
jgi:3-hydroxymyristoyl/3-hydroxydecanoyl-(acyl carrier protein) dehydratase